MKKPFNLLMPTLIIVAFGLTSCTHYYYIPPAQNVPLFQGKNEYQATISAGGNDEVSTTDVQVAYSITNNIAVMANAMVAEGGEKSSADWGRGKYIDAAIGYYKPFCNYWVFEIFTGFGNGKQHHHYNDGTSDLSFTKLIFQPSIGLTYNAFDIALTTGISYINFYKINNPFDRNHEEFYTLNNISQNHNSYLFEPSITLRAGWKYAKFQLQILSAENLSHSGLQFLYNKVSMGITFSFAHKFEKKTFQKQ